MEGREGGGGGGVPYCVSESALIAADGGGVAIVIYRRPGGFGEKRTRRDADAHPDRNRVRFIAPGRTGATGNPGHCYNCDYHKSNAVVHASAAVAFTDQGADTVGRNTNRGWIR